MTHHHAETHHHRFVSGLHLFSWSHLLAHAWSSPRQRLAPSGARIFYYTRLALLRRGIEPAIMPTAEPLPPAVVAAYLKMAPESAAHLAADFHQVVRVLASPMREGMKVLATHAAPHFVGLSEQLSTLEKHQGVTHHHLLAQWDTCWQSLADQPLPALVLLLNEERLLVAPVARPENSERAALRFLCARLAEDRYNRPWRLPPPEAFLYEEPFLHWFARSLLTQPWFIELCQRPLTKDRTR